MQILIPLGMLNMQVTNKLLQYITTSYNYHKNVNLRVCDEHCKNKLSSAVFNKM